MSNKFYRARTIKQGGHLPGGAKERLALFAEWTGAPPPDCVLIDQGDGPTFSDEILQYADDNGLNLDWFWLGDERGLVMAYHHAALEERQ